MMTALASLTASALTGTAALAAVWGAVVLWGVLAWRPSLRVRRARVAVSRLR